MTPWLASPNIPDADVPVGPDDKHNVVLRTVGEPRHFDFEPKPHWDLGTALDYYRFRIRREAIRNAFFMC